MSAAPGSPSRRLDQWLWFARFAKSRSLAARRCAAGMIAVNGVTVTKPSHGLRVGDGLELVQGGFRRSLRVLDLGTRRGPASEARLLYEEPVAPVRLAAIEPAWTPLLQDGPAAE